VKISLLIHYFLVNHVFFPSDFYAFKNVPCKALYGGKKCGLEQLLDDVEFIPNLSHYCKKLAFFYVSETLATYVEVCLCTHALAHVRRLLPTYVGRGSFWSFYCQKQIFAYLKSYIFHFNTRQVNLIFGWSLIGMATGRVQAGLFHTRTQLAGLPQKLGPSLFIKRIFFLNPKPGPSGTRGPPNHATIWA